jgi:hypothetical protein
MKSSMIKAFLFALAFLSFNGLCFFLAYSFSVLWLAIIIACLGNLAFVIYYFAVASNAKCPECGESIGIASNGLTFYNGVCSKCKSI